MDREIMVEIKKLSDRVQYLEDQLVKQKRENANLMEELEVSRASGVSSSLVGQVNKKFSEIMQTEEKIQMTVADVSNEARRQYSKYEQTAQKIETEVADLWTEDGNNKGNITKITQTATDITSIVKKMFGAPESINHVPGENDDKSFIYKYDNMIYYFDDEEEEWKSDDDGVISSMFQQTAYGFVMNGNVKISGNQIVDGVATLRDNVYIGDASTMDGLRGITFNSVAKISTIKGADLFPNDYAGLSISAPLLKLGTVVDFSDATVTGLYAVFE